MSPRFGRWIAWALFALFLVMMGTGLLLVRSSGHAFRLGDRALLIAFLLLASVGGLIGSRRPDHPVGWLLLATPMSMGLRAVSFEYAYYALIVLGGALPFGSLMAWVSLWAWVPSVGLFATFLLVFPTGRLLSARWRPLAWLSAGVFLLVFFLIAFRPGPIDDLERIRNPFGLEDAAETIDLLSRISFRIILPLVILASMASVVVRFRRSQGEERAQLKWFLYASFIFTLSLMYSIASAEFASIPALPESLSSLPLALAQSFFAVSIGIAILKYRLYDIDLIIRRTLIYGVLTGALALVYFGSVAGLQALLGRTAGDRSTLAVVISTLAMAALFTPLRQRVQRFIDRRFYRTRYNVEKTLEQFSSAVRDEVALEALIGNLVTVVGDTMQPRHVSVWLAGRPTRRPE